MRCVRLNLASLPWSFANDDSLAWLGSSHSKTSCNISSSCFAPLNPRLHASTPCGHQLNLAQHTFLYPALLQWHLSSKLAALRSVGVVVGRSSNSQTENIECTLKAGDCQCHVRNPIILRLVLPVAKYCCTNAE